MSHLLNGPENTSTMREYKGAVQDRIGWDGPTDDTFSPAAANCLKSRHSEF